MRLLMENALATPRRVYIGVGVSALVAGVGAHALPLQIGRHPVQLLVAHDPSPASASTAAPAKTVDPVAPRAPLTPNSEPTPASFAAPPATQVSAPDITSSIAPAAQDKQHQSSVRDGERRSAALGPPQIGALLRDKPIDGELHLVRAAQIALAKLGYAVKQDGAEDGATRRALRHFERAHGLAPSTRISSELVRQLTAAAGG
jgi:hypothetical protein